MNKVFIIGNLTRDPEMRSTRDGVAVCSFTVAVNRRSKGAQAGQQDADFFRVAAWRELGELCHKYLTKGRKVAVTGSVSATAYTAQDGTARASMDINAAEVEFLSPRDELPQPTVGEIEKQQRDQQTGMQQVQDDDLPF